MTSIILPTSATSIGNQAFSLCTGINSIIIPSSLISIGSSTFYGCESLKYIAIPSSLNSIGSNAFESSGLTSIIIPSSISTIPFGCFMSCSSLTSITIPSTISSLEASAFQGCTSLTSISIPTSLSSISFALFLGCSSLTSVTLSSSVTQIESYAFDNCSNLISIYVNRTVPPSLIESNEFDFENINKVNCILHVPIGSKAAYQTADNWKDFQNIVEDLPNAIDDAIANKIKVSTQQGVATISSVPKGETITIYNLLGTAIYNQPAQAETVSVSLPARSVYIVRVGNESVKVLY